ncbi:cupin domain-containing protein [Microbulbifer epialgicus]|uniref:Cupin domain-containing protein n=1 Tax=Microbulbifer epialgicus TaxID=393907 RepID=A0ABV4NWY6_9GAMM
MQPVNLIEHPEGGKFLEVFRSNATVTNKNGQERSALTHIYFSLGRGEISRFHKVQSDEVWSLYQGSGLYLYTWDGLDKEVKRTELSAQCNTYCDVVPAGVWQAAEPIGESVLVGCSVGPGFDFSDFEMIDPRSDAAKKLRGIDSNFIKFIES